MDGTIRANIYPGLEVDIVLKKDQPTGKLTRGIVKDILTSSRQHHRGIKVRLQDGQIGRIKVGFEQAQVNQLKETSTQQTGDVTMPQLCIFHEGLKCQFAGLNFTLSPCDVCIHR